METLYPEIDCYNSLQLDVGDGHRIYVEEAGRRDGIPVVFLHGGPGSGCNPNHRRYFDSDRYRVVIFDQRGCNRSSPAGCVEHNTTQYLLHDIEQIREHLGIEKWLAFGGSWGATLALLYAEAYPARVTGLVLRGSFLAREADLAWFVRHGANRIFPDYWNNFIHEIPEEERSDLVSAYHRRVHGTDRSTQEKFARLWSEWAGRVVTWNLQNSAGDNEVDVNKMVHEVLIETHYAKNRYFIAENQILDNISKIPDVPIIMIHGRRDMTCTLETSWLLHCALPDAEFNIVPDGGHLAGEPPMTDALVTATNKMAAKLAK